MSSREGVFEAVGREALGPLLHSYALWLHERAREDRVEKLFFLARDGYMMQQAYRAAVPVAEQIPNEYMFASRRLFNFAAIKRIDAGSLHLLMGDRVEMPVGQYLKRIGLEVNDYLNELQEAGFSSPDQVVTAADRPELQALFEALEGPIVKAARRERALVLRYAKQLANWGRERCAIVDIGWHGSLQESLRVVLGLPRGQLHGYYFGLEATSVAGEKMAAYLDERRPGQWYSSWRTFKRCRELFEVFFTRSLEGSIVGLEEVEPGRFEPIRDIVTMPAATARGIDALQLEAVAQISAGKPLPRREVLRRLRRLLSRPTTAEAAVLGDIPHQEGFGGYGREDKLASPRYGLRQYLLRPGALISELRTTFWRAGYLARLKF
jgi:hypothetical protein